MKREVKEGRGTKKEMMKKKNREAENGSERKSELEAEADGGQEFQEKTRSELKERGAEYGHDD